jgi:hypothetical protein
MSPLATTVEKMALSAEFGLATPSGVPATHTIGLMVAPTWTTGATVAVGAYVIPVTAFASRAPATLGRVFKCTAITTGITAGAEPTWPSTAGGTVVDGGVTWTEISTLMAAGTASTVGLLEPSGSGYTRPTVTNNGTNWVLQAGGNPASVLNLSALAFGTTTAAWGQIVGGIVYDATPTNVRGWGLLAGASAVATVPAIAVSIPASQLSVALT